MIRLVYIILLFWTSFCFADLYYWTDNNGVKHVSNIKPETEAVNLEIKNEYAHHPKEKTNEMVRNDRVETKSTDQEKIKKREKYTQNQDVIMYSTQRCGYCRKARSFFKANNIEYTEYDVDTSKQALKKFKSLNGNGVPLIFVGNYRISGFNEPLLRSYLDLN